MGGGSPGPPRGWGVALPFQGHRKLDETLCTCKVRACVQPCLFMSLAAWALTTEDESCPNSVLRKENNNALTLSSLICRHLPICPS